MPFGKPLVSLLLFLIVYSFTVFENSFCQSVSEPENKFIPVMGVTGSYSNNSFRAWGTMENTRQSFLNMQFTHTEIKVKSLRFELSSDLILSGWIRYPSDGLNGPKESVFGIGLVPVRLNLPVLKKHNTPFITTSSGVIMTDKPFPDSRGTRLNYILEFGIGYQFSAGSNKLVQAGYKLHHLSNGNTGNENPGIDSHMFFFGLLFQL